MTTALISILVCLHPSVRALPALDLAGPGQAGIAKFYDRGLVQRVARKRGLALEPHMAALSGPGGCGRIGAHVWASVNGHEAARFLVVDCSQARDEQRHKAEGLLLEVSYEDALQWFPAGAGKSPAVLWGP